MCQQCAVTTASQDLHSFSSLSELQTRTLLFYRFSVVTNSVMVSASVPLALRLSRYEYAFCPLLTQIFYSKYLPNLQGLRWAIAVKFPSELDHKTSNADRANRHLTLGNQKLKKSLLTPHFFAALKPLVAIPPDILPRLAGTTSEFTLYFRPVYQAHL